MDETVHITHLTWWQFYKQVQDLYCLVKQSSYQPDLVVGLARGGLWPAKYIATALDVPISSLRVTRTDANGPFAVKGEAQVIDADFLLQTELGGKNILIVDDISTYGKTIQAANEYVRRLHPKDIKIATLSSTQIDGKKACTPDFYLTENPKNSWMVFPWDVELKQETVLSLFREIFGIEHNQMNQDVTINCVGSVLVSNDESFHYEKTYAFPFTKGSEFEPLYRSVEEYLRNTFQYTEKPVIKVYRDTYYIPPASMKDRTFRLREICPVVSGGSIAKDAAEMMVVAVYEDTVRKPILPGFSPEYTEIFLLRGRQIPLQRLDVGKMKNIFHLELRNRGIMRLAEVEKTRVKYEITTGEDGDMDRTKRPVMRIAFDVIHNIVLPEVLASYARVPSSVVGSTCLAEIEINENAGKDGMKFATDISAMLEKTGARIRPGRKIDWIASEKKKITLDPELTGFIDI
jgi:hypoxanthine phosphoribosyltransferase